MGKSFSGRGWLVVGLGATEGTEGTEVKGQKRRIDCVRPDRSAKYPGSIEFVMSSLHDWNGYHAKSHSVSSVGSVAISLYFRAFF
jgi:hypothetical protein